MSLVEFLRVLQVSLRAYRLASRPGVGSGYAAITVRGVPQVCCFMAVGREAWRVSQRVVEEFRSAE